jgi:hypothetical protein
MTGIDVEGFDIDGKMALPAEATSCVGLHGILLMTGSTSGKKNQPIVGWLLYSSILKN